MSVRIIEGDALTKLREMPDCSVQMCCTSPPYFGLRDYGVSGQLGLEKTPQLYVEAMIGVFAEVKRVLRDDGTLWLNIGDSYSAQAGQRKTTDIAGIKQQSNVASVGAPSRCAEGCKPKDLIGIPWMLAFALRADGWYLRSEIIWHKPNVMPESVLDRPTKAHEQIFLLSKADRYLYDADAIREPIADSTAADPRSNSDGVRRLRGFPGPASNGGTRLGDGGFRNRRTVWTVNTAAYREAHFATFPSGLIEPCILAGSAKGDTVLDPFMGAGTTGLVADRLGRNAIGIELNPKYAAMARERIHSDNPLFGDVA